MMDDPSSSPLQPVFFLVQDIFRKIVIYFIVKLERILIVVHQIQGVKSPSDVLIFQTAHCIADMAQIALGGLVGEQDLIVPVETDKIVLAFAEQIQELPLKRSVSIIRFYIHCIFATLNSRTFRFIRPIGLGFFFYMRFLTTFMYTACSISILHIINFFYLPVHLIRDLLRFVAALKYSALT